MKPGMKSCPFFGKFAVRLASVLQLEAWAAAQETNGEESPGLLNLVQAEEPGLKDRSVWHTFENRWVGNSVTEDPR